MKIRFKIAIIIFLTISPVVVIVACNSVSDETGDIAEATKALENVVLNEIDLGLVKENQDIKEQVIDNLLIDNVIEAPLDKVTDLRIFYALQTLVMMFLLLRKILNLKNFLCF
jgi:hypothetical protein